MEQEFTITSAQYIADDRTGANIVVRATVEGLGELFVPLDPKNRHYAEIMRQVEAGELTIQEAE